MLDNCYFFLFEQPVPLMLALNGEPEVGFELGSVWFRAEFRPSLDIIRLFYRLS